MVQNLSEQRCRALLKTPGKYGDGGGLWFVVGANSRAKWVLRLTVHGKRREMGLGSYPTKTLKAAREQAREHHTQAQAGIDPVSARRDEKNYAKAVPTFGECASQVIANHRSGWRNEKHAQQWENTIQTYCAPLLSLKVDAVTQEHVLAVLRPIWQVKHETSSRLRGRIETVLGFAHASGWRKGENPAMYRGSLEYLLPKVKRVTKPSASLPWGRISQFWRVLEQSHGVGADALAFLILTACRSGEIRYMTWQEVNFEDSTWTIPGSRMKLGITHSVPLSAQAIQILRAQPRGEPATFVFSVRRGLPMSDATLAATIKRINSKQPDTEKFRDPDGREAVPHGFRSTFRMWAAENSLLPRDVAEFALAHKLPDSVEAAYQKSTLFVKRREMMSEWGHFVAEETLPHNDDTQH